MSRLRGVHVPHRKNAAALSPEELPTPPEVRIPMSMHIGAPAIPVVKEGDEVKVGQLIGKADGFVSANVHASVSGKVKSIYAYDETGGRKAVSITITADGLQTPWEGISPAPAANYQEFLDAIRNSGVVGLGGAGFPTGVKLSVKEPDKLEYIIINGAECEPYITSDTRTMIDDAELVRDGLVLLKRFYGAKIVIGIEDNKPEPIKTMLEIAGRAPGVEVRALPSIYPQGAEKVLIYNITGRVVPEGGLPLDTGVIVVNCTTLAAIARYINTGVPVVSKCVTVDGTAVRNPKNIIAPIGTPVRMLFDYCGGLSDDVKKVLYGGPMMGIALPNLDMPVLKSTNAVLAFREKDAAQPTESACIRCGRCAANCPMRLAALEFERAYLLKKPEVLEHFKVDLCMECGCCAYNCPAHRPLIQSIKLAKAMLSNYKAEQKAAEAKLEAKMEEEQGRGGK